MRRHAAASLLLLILCARAGADVPLRVEQLIYSVTAYNGSDYSSTFALQTADTIYLLAGTDNLLSVRKTLVYWWPLTAEWKTDTDSLNQSLAGSLELRSPGGSVRTIPLQRATYFSIPSSAGQQWKVLIGPDADREIARADKLSEDYFAAVTDYQKKAQEYDAQVETLGDRISELESQGRDAGEIAARLSGLQRPTAPPAPDAYIEAPEQAQDVFIVNLAPGQYSARLLAPDGRTLEGSDKRIVAYTQRRMGGIGYEVIPSDKWTRPEESKTPASVLYVNGTTDLYLRPFLEQEVNDLFYEKTVSNQSTGNPALYKWVRTEQVTGALSEAARPGKETVTIVEHPFIVAQSTGSGLGYTIAPFDPKTAAPDQSPSMIAFPVSLKSADRIIRLRTLDSRGHPIAGSERQIRIVARPPLLILWALPAFAPVLAMVIVFIARARRNRMKGNLF
ncbi:MAG: hypothetical protein ABSF77_20955 [Spirochaetia bacterium]